jgi:hypothetical protein
MTTVLWKDSKRANAKELIDWLLSKKEPNKIPFNLPFIIAAKELASSSAKSDLTQADVWPVLDRMKQQNRSDVEDFEQIYAEFRKSASAKAHTNKLKWYFFIPLQAILDPDIAKTAHLRVLGKDFQLRSAEMVKSRIGKITINNLEELSILVGRSVTNIPPTFLIVSSEAASWRIAWERIVPAFDTLRGMIELSFGRGGWRISSYEHPRRNVQHPTWMIIQGQDKQLMGIHFDIDQEDKAKPYQFTLQHFDVLKQNAKLFRIEPNTDSTASVIVDCLRLYSQAMDARFSYMSFIGFWQLAEAITRSETIGGDTKKVIERIAWHNDRMNLVASGYKNILIGLGNKRNNIVHRGIHDVDEDDVNIFKIACENALLWLINQLKTLPTKSHLNEFYSLRDVGETKLDSLEDCIKYIRRNRSRK